MKKLSEILLNSFQDIDQEKNKGRPRFWVKRMLSPMNCQSHQRHQILHHMKLKMLTRSSMGNLGCTCTKKTLKMQTQILPTIQSQNARDDRYLKNCFKGKALV